MIAAHASALLSMLGTLFIPALLLFVWLLWRSAMKARQ